MRVGGGRDENNLYFVERNPTLFVVIIMFLTYKSFYLKNQLFIRKWFLFLSCVFIFHNIVLTANTMEENHIKSKTTFNYLTLNSGFIYSHFDTFPPEIGRAHV